MIGWSAGLLRMDYVYTAQRDATLGRQISAATTLYTDGQIARPRQICRRLFCWTGVDESKYLDHHVDASDIVPESNADVLLEHPLYVAQPETSYPVSADLDVERRIHLQQQGSQLRICTLCVLCSTAATTSKISE